MQEESKPKYKWGGKRPNQTGRPKRMDEEQIIAKLSPMAELAFQKLSEKIAEGDITAIKLFCSYFMGMPTQRVENKIEGQLNQVNIEVIKPKLTPDEVINN